MFLNGGLDFESINSMMNTYHDHGKHRHDDKHRNQYYEEIGLSIRNH